MACAYSVFGITITCFVLFGCAPSIKFHFQCLLSCFRSFDKKRSSDRPLAYGWAVPTPVGIGDGWLAACQGHVRACGWSGGGLSKA